MTYLLDTNTISEFTKAPPDECVMAWFGSIPGNSTYLSVATIAEIRMGVENRRINRHGVDLERWLNEQLLPRYGERIVEVGPDIADYWGRYMLILRNLGRRNYAIDALIAATAAARGLTVVTRNERDFAPLGVPVLNPWRWTP